ncbi:MAG: hypothetical protein ACTSW1_03500 [Candidatus Hodarchaeales archaeon]
MKFHNNEKFEDMTGLDELDTQVKLFQLGVESFSPYASTGKVDMIIRSENGEKVRYADIKVCSGNKINDHMIWKLEISFFMNNQSFIILTARIPDKEGVIAKNYFIIDSKQFLKLTKDKVLKTENDKWVLSLLYKDLLILSGNTKGTLSKLGKSFKEWFNDWTCLLDWRINPPIKK